MYALISEVTFSSSFLTSSFPLGSFPLASFLGAFDFSSFLASLGYLAAYFADPEATVRLSGIAKPPFSSVPESLNGSH